MSEATKKKLIIDTDCGSDDAMAIAMALRDPNYEILLFTTVCGNVNQHQAAINTLSTIERAGTYEPPVYEGCTVPLLNIPAYAVSCHGTDGMGDIGIVPKRLTISEGHAVLKIIETLEANEANTIEIITIGPLTNIAMAMRLAPETMKKVKRISMMGSAGLGGGNTSAVAEYNIWQDAEAARIVFEFGVPLLLVGWDACLGDAMLGAEDIRKIEESGELGKFTIDINRCLKDLNEQRFGYPCLDMADPSAIAAALYPECIDTCDDYYCQVDTSSGISYGNVLVDRHATAEKAPNVAVCSKLKGNLFKEYILKTLS